MADTAIESKRTIVTTTESWKPAGWPLGKLRPIPPGDRADCPPAAGPLPLTRIFHEHRNASSEKSACQRQGDLVAASPDKVGPSGANIPRLREMFGLKTPCPLRSRG